MAKENFLSTPNPLASRKEKASEQYGLAYASFMYNQFYKISPILNEKIARLKNNRKYAEGLQSIQDVRELMGAKGTSPLNLDIRPINYISKIVDIIVSVLMEQPFTVECNAIDPESKLIEEKLKNKIYAAMLLKKVDAQHKISERTGIPLTPQGMKIPDTDEEAELMLEMNGKMGVSLAMEEAIQFVLDNNDFEYEVKRRIIRDLVVLKAAAIYRDYDENYNIVVKCPDFCDLVYPYSKYDNFKNIPYVGWVEMMTIEQIGMQAVNKDGSPKYTAEQLMAIAKEYAGKNNNPTWQSNWGMSYEGYYSNATLIKPYYNFNIPVMRFWFLSISKEVLVKTSKKGKDYYDWKAKPADVDNVDNKQNIGTREKEWRYEGCWIVNSTYLFNYKESDDIPRERIQGGYNPKTMLPIDIIAPDIYDMENKSIVEKAIPAEEQLNLIEQKIQQFCIDARPPGYAFNTAVLEEMKAGHGNDPLTSPKQMHDDFTQTGKLLYYAVDQQGNPLNINPVTPLPNGFGQQFAELMNLRQMYIQTINSVMGFNEAMTATLPSAEMPVGTQEIARQGTINSLMPLYNAAIYLIGRCLKGVSLMISDNIEYNREGFIEAIGMGATSEIEMFRQLPLAIIGVNVKIGSTEQEKAELRQWIDLSIKNGDITVADALRVQQDMRANVHLAQRILTKLIAKNREDKLKESMALQQQNANVQVQSAQAASQFKQQEIQLEVQAKIQELKAESALKSQFSSQEFQQQMELQKLKNIGSYTVAEIAAGGKVNVQESANRGKIVSQQIEQNTQIAKAHIVHHSDVLQNEQLHKHAMELQENEPPEKVEEKD